MYSITLRRPALGLLTAVTTNAAPGAVLHGEQGGIILAGYSIAGSVLIVTWGVLAWYEHRRPR